MTEQGLAQLASSLAAGPGANEKFLDYLLSLCPSPVSSCAHADDHARSQLSTKQIQALSACMRFLAQSGPNAGAERVGQLAPGWLRLLPVLHDESIAYDLTCSSLKAAHRNGLISVYVAVAEVLQCFAHGLDARQQHLGRLAGAPSAVGCSLGAPVSMPALCGTLSAISQCADDVEASLPRGLRCRIAEYLLRIAIATKADSYKRPTPTAVQQAGSSTASDGPKLAALVLLALRSIFPAGDVLPTDDDGASTVSGVGIYTRDTISNETGPLDQHIDGQQARRTPSTVDEAAAPSQSVLVLSALAQESVFAAEECLEIDDAVLQAASVELLVRLAMCLPRTRSRTVSIMTSLLSKLLSPLSSTVVPRGPTSASETSLEAQSDQILLLQTVLAGIVELARHGQISPFVMSYQSATHRNTDGNRGIGANASNAGRRDSAFSAKANQYTIDMSLVGTALQSVRVALLSTLGAGSGRKRHARPGGVGTRMRGIQPHLQLGAAQLQTLTAAQQQQQQQRKGQSTTTRQAKEAAATINVDRTDLDDVGAGASTAAAIAVTLRGVLNAGMCALMCVELGIRAPAEFKYRMPPAVLDGSAAFDGSVTAATLFEMSRELASAREASVISTQRRRRESGPGSAFASTTGASAGQSVDGAQNSVASDKAAAEEAKERQRSEMAMQAMNRCVELINLMCHIASSCDHVGITSIVGDVLVNVWVQEKDISASDNKAKGVGMRMPNITMPTMPKMSTLPPASGPAVAGGDAADGSIAASASTGDPRPGMFGRFFGGSSAGKDKQTSAAAVGGPVASQPPAVPMRLKIDVQGTSTASLPDPSDRTILKRALLSALARAAVLRSANSGCYSVIAETMTMRYALAAQAGEAARVILGVIAGRLASIAEGLKAAANAVRLEQRISITDTDATRGTRRRLDSEVSAFEGKRSDFRHRMLVMVTQLGAEACKKLSSQTAAPSKGAAPAVLDQGFSVVLAAVLPALAHCLTPTVELPDIGSGSSSAVPASISSSYNVPQRSAPAGIKMYRSMWLSLVVCRLTDLQQRVWPASWYRAVRAIAAHTPVLVVRGAANYFDGDLSSDSAAASPVPDVVVSEVRAYMSASLPEHRDALLTLPSHQLLFLRSVYALETLRASTGVCKAPLLYLYDASIEREGLGALMASICDAAFRAFLSRAMRMGRCEERNAMLTDHALYFLAHTAHRFARVRNASFKSLVDMVDRFPQLLWEEPLIRALLDTVEALSRRAHQGNHPAMTSVVGRPAPTLNTSETDGKRLGLPTSTLLQTGGVADLNDPHGESSPLVIPSSSYVMHTPSAQTELVDVLSDVTELASQWMLRAVVSAPSETRALYQRFVSRLALSAQSVSSTMAPTVVVGSAGSAVIRSTGSRVPSTVHAYPETVQSGDGHAGLHVGLHGIASTAAGALPPSLRPYGMMGRVRHAGLSLLGRTPNSLTAGLSHLSHANAHVRWSGVGATGVAGAAGGTPSASTTPAAASGAAASAAVSGSAGQTSLGGFQSTSWARASLGQVLSGTGARASAPTTRIGGSVVTAIDEADEEDDDDDSASVRKGDAASVTSRSTVGAGAAGGAQTQGRGGRGSVTTSGAGPLSAEQAAVAAALGLSFGTATSLVASVHAIDFSRDTVLQPAMDPITLLGTRLAPSFAASSERRAHFLGQIEGMAAFHNSDMSGSKRSAAAFQYVLRKQLAHGAGSLLVLTQNGWRDELLNQLHSATPSPAGTSSTTGRSSEFPASQLFDADVINDTIGVVPAHAIPAFILEPHGGAKSAPGGLRVKRLRGGVALVYGPDSDTTDVSDSSRSSDSESTISTTSASSGAAKAHARGRQRSGFERPRLPGPNVMALLKSKRQLTAATGVIAENGAAAGDQKLLPTARSSSQLSHMPSFSNVFRGRSSPKRGVETGALTARGASAPAVASTRSTVAVANGNVDAGAATRVAVPAMVHLAIAGWRHALRQKTETKQKIESELSTTLFRTTAFLVWLHDEDNNGVKLFGPAPHADVEMAASANGSEARLPAQSQLPQDRRDSATSASSGVGVNGVGGIPPPSVPSNASSASQQRERANRLKEEAVQQLLPLLVWLPVRAFTTTSISGAVECWSWLLASVPTLRLKLVAEIVAAWRWTITMRFGLFSGDSATTSAHNASSTASGSESASAGQQKQPNAKQMAADFLSPPSYTSGVDPSVLRTGAAGTQSALPRLPPGLCNVEPHRLLIAFFEERFRVCRSRSGDELAHLVTAMTAAVADSTRLSTAPASFGTRVRLLHLSMCVMQSAHYPDFVREQPGARWENGPIVAIPTGLMRDAQVSASPGLLRSASATSGVGVVAGNSGTSRPSVSLGGAGPWNGPLPGKDISIDRYADNDDDGDFLDEDGDGAGGELVSPTAGGRGSSFASAAAMGWDPNDLASDSGGSSTITAPWYLRRDNAPKAGSAYAGTHTSRRCCVDEYGIQTSSASMSRGGRITTIPGMKGAIAPLGSRSDAWPTISAGSLAVFRERIYRCALSWFQLQPSYYEVATSGERVSQDFPFVVSLCRLLQADGRFHFSSDVTGSELSFTAAGSAPSSTTGTTSDPASIAGSKIAAAVATKGGKGLGVKPPPVPGQPVMPSRTPTDGKRGSGAGGLLVSPNAASTTTSVVRSGSRGMDLRRMVLGRLPAASTAAASAASLSSAGSFADVQQMRAGGPSRRVSAASMGLLGLSSSVGASSGPAGGSSMYGRMSSVYDLDGGSYASIGRRSNIDPYLLLASHMPAGRDSDGHGLVDRSASRMSFSIPMARYSSMMMTSGSNIIQAINSGLAISSPLQLGAAAGIAAVRNMRDLSIVLMGHEIDRMVAWHNPLDAEERHLPDEKEFSLDAKLVALTNNPAAGYSALGKGEWARHVATAWAVSPRLALQLWRRFKSVPDVTLAMQQYVLTDPAAVRHDPEAVRLLVTADTVANDSLQLQHLLLWAPASFPTILDLLSRCSQADDPLRPRAAPSVSHPVVAAYVVRCLRRFSADTVVFYLPQLVQGLRHDSSGQLVDFLFTVSQSSMLVAHQLIWLLVSESKDSNEDKHGHGHAPAAPVSSSPAASNAAAGAGGDTNGNAGLQDSLNNEPGMAALGLSSPSSPGAASASHGFQHHLKGPDPLPTKAINLTRRIVATFPATAKAMFELQYSFWDHITNISGRLKTEVADKSQRRPKIKEFLKDLQREAERDHYYAKGRIFRAVKQELKQQMASPTPDGGAGVGAAAVTAGGAITGKEVPADSIVADGILGQADAAAAAANAGKRPLPLAGAIRVLGGNPDATAPKLQGGAGGPAGLPGINMNMASSSHADAETQKEKSDDLARAAAEEAPDIIDEIYLPTNPYAKLVSVDMESGRAMQSAAKCPFMLTFTVQTYAGPDSTLRKYDRREARRKRDRARMAAHARGDYARGKHLKLKLRQTDDPMLRARLGAQHAALQLRRQVQKQRVQMGLTLERTREQMERGMTTMVAGVSKGVAGMSKGMKMGGMLRKGMSGRGPQLSGSGDAGSAAAGGSNAEGGGGGRPGLGASTMSTIDEADGHHSSAEQPDTGRSDASAVDENGDDQHADGAPTDSQASSVSDDGDDTQASSDTGLSDSGSSADTADEAAYAEADGVRRGSDEEGEGEEAPPGSADAQHVPAPAAVGAAVDGATAGAVATDGAAGAQPGRRRLRDRLGLSTLRNKLRRHKKDKSGMVEELHPSTVAGGAEADNKDSKKVRRRLRAFRLGRNLKSGDIDASPELQASGSGNALDASHGLADSQEDGMLAGHSSSRDRMAMDGEEGGRLQSGAGGGGAGLTTSSHGHKRARIVSPFRRHKTNPRGAAATSNIPPAVRGGASLVSAAKNIGLTKLGLMFKVFDDCRQDVLAIQVIDLFKHAFEAARIGLYLYPYRVIPTRTGSKKTPGGIVEMVPDVRSRDEIGKAGYPTLFDFFTSTFGRPGGAEFEMARRNMIRSLAAYAIVCYILRIKDRHNGNLLVTSRGHLVHIDFGFLLGISPGGNLGFETAAFKMTQEMVDIMGGSVDTEMFQYFNELTCRAFLLARDNMDAVHGLVAGMADSGLPCYLFPDTLQKLYGRFRPDDSDLRACRFMRDETLLAAKSMTTVLYDGIQKLQNNIHSEAWQ